MLGALCTDTLDYVPRMSRSPAARRLSGLLLGSLFAWLSVVTGWSPCAAPSHTGHAVASGGASDAALHQHHAAHGQPISQSTAPAAPEHAPVPGAPDAGCPMAMACAPVSLAGHPVAALVAVTLPVASTLGAVSDRTPDSTPRAPEPPPPRA